jgi:GNAT superfamily N-acetyltransferase
MSHAHEGAKVGTPGDHPVSVPPRHAHEGAKVGTPAAGTRVVPTFALDHDHHEALGALGRNGLIASAHWFLRPHDPSLAELAIEVADNYQRRGVGSRLLNLLGHRARAQGIVKLTATVLAENAGTTALTRYTDWPPASTIDGPELAFEMAIEADPSCG